MAWQRSPALEEREGCSGSEGGVSPRTLLGSVGANSTPVNTPSFVHPALLRDVLWVGSGPDQSCKSFKEPGNERYSGLLDSLLASDDCWSPSEAGRYSLWAWESLKSVPCLGLADRSQLN